MDDNLLIPGRIIVIRGRGLRAGLGESHSQVKRMNTLYFWGWGAPTPGSE
jgi:hypothetical protein